MVPPEDFDFGGLTDDTSSRRIMMPRVSLRFFDNEVSCPSLCPSNILKLTPIRRRSVLRTSL